MKNNSTFNLIAVLILGFVIGLAGTKQYYQDKAVSYGCGEYNITTTEFYWRTK
jgi:hypothetical protein